MIEQIDLLNNDNVLSTHVFGLGIDDEVSYRIEDLATAEDFWTHRDDLGSVTSLTDSNGAVVERYEYGDYGDVRIFDAAGVALAASSYNIHHLYTGRTVIPGTGLMDYRWRVMDPETGRFVQRDPLGYIDSMSMYAYVIDGPYVYYDPYGLSIWLDLLDGFQVILDTLDGTLAEETNRNSNAITRMTLINAKKARDRGDDCLAYQILMAGLADANKIAGDGVALAEQSVDAIQQVVDEIVTAPIPGPGIPGLGQISTNLGKIVPKNFSITAPTLKRMKNIPANVRTKYRAPKGGNRVTRQTLKKDEHGKGPRPVRGNTKHDQGNTHSHTRDGSTTSNGKPHFRTKHRWW